MLYYIKQKDIIGALGVGGNIFDPKGKIVNSFAWGLMKKTNNQAE